MTAFNKKKEEAQAHLDMAARKKALKQLGMRTDSSLLITPQFTTLSTEDFTAPQSRWSSFRPATLLLPPLQVIFIRVILVISPPASQNPEMFAWRLRAEERVEQHFQRVRADE